MTLELKRIYRFEAARWLPHLPPEHPCSRLHGHSFRVELVVAGPVDPTTGMVLDYADIDAAAHPAIARLDHRCLNDLAVDTQDPLLANPTTEHVCIWLWRQIHPQLPLLKYIEVAETQEASARYSGQ